MGCTRVGGGRTCEQGLAGWLELPAWGAEMWSVCPEDQSRMGTVGIRAADSQQAAEKSECTEEAILGGKCGQRDSEGNTHFY